MKILENFVYGTIKESLRVGGSFVFGPPGFWPNLCRSLCRNPTVLAHLSAYFSVCVSITSLPFKFIPSAAVSITWAHSISLLATSLPELRNQRSGVRVAPGAPSFH